MKRLPLLTATVLAAGVLLPWHGQAASTLDQINQRISTIKKEQNNASNQISSIENRIQTIENEKTQVKQDIMHIDLKLNETQERIQELDLQIDTTTLKAQEAAVQLDEALKRVEERNDLLKTRVKVMYEMGDVSYLEVLLGSTDFGDFLNRLRAVNLIINQDTKILEDNIKDKETIALKKKEVDDYLSKLQGYFAAAEQLKADLKRQQKERTVVMAQLEKEEGELEEIKEEHEQAMLALVQEMKNVLYEKNKLLSQRKFSGGKFAWPVPDSSRITSYFGGRKDPFTGKSSGHNGMDIGAPQGTTIIAAAEGTVIVSGYVRGFGNCIIIDHGGGISTLYGHIREGGLMVKEGQEVKKGDKIAEVGSTGRSTGPHLHFTVLKGNTAVDPMGYLKN